MVFHKKVKFPLDFRRRLCYTNQVLKSGCGAVGSALPWGGRGRKFKSCHSDQQKRNEPCVHSASAFLQRKTMKLCPKTAPAPMAQRGGAGFPKARMRALGVPGCGRKFKSCHSDHNRGCPNGTSPIIFCVAGYAEIAEKAKAFSKRACARQVSSLVTQTSRSGMNRAFIPLLLFCKEKP